MEHFHVPLQKPRRRCVPSPFISFSPKKANFFFFFFFLLFLLDVGKVLIGVQVPSQDNPAFDEFLETLGYPYVEETQNEVYTMFLKS